MQHTIDWRTDFSYVKLVGNVDKPGLILANKYMHGDNRFYTSKASIWDFTEATFSNLSEEDLTYILAIDIGASLTVKKFKKALIIVDAYANELANSFIRNLAKSNSDWEIRIFDSFEPALLWINS